MEQLSPLFPFLVIFLLNISGGTVTGFCLFFWDLFVDERCKAEREIDFYINPTVSIASRSVQYRVRKSIEKLTAGMSRVGEDWRQTTTVRFWCLFHV